MVDQGTSSGDSPPTIDVGGAAFATTRLIIVPQNETRERKAEALEGHASLVAKGSSYLSYFYLGVCSSVLYLAPEASNDTVLFRGESDNAIALEIHYHKPCRSADFQWATRTFVEKNLGNGRKIEDLPVHMQEQLASFNSLYKNVKIGDRYTLQYTPSVGMSLSLNGNLLGTVGGKLGLSEQQELARLVYSVWFGSEAPFSQSMKEELLTPIDPPVQIPVCSSTATGKISSVSSIWDSREMILANSMRDERMTEAEKKELESLGILQLLEDESGSSAQRKVMDDQSIPSLDGQPFSAWTRIQQFIYASESTPPTLERIHASESESSLSAMGTDHSRESKYNPILLGVCGAAFLLPHLAILLSLPPVLMRSGAPYLPTFANKMTTMFDLIRSHVLRSRHMQRKLNAQSLQFVDLGSGDGRVVFRAAREGLFVKSVGYEINPALHLFANVRRLLTPGYWNSTEFYMRDLWKIKLHEYDVVAVYGLAPIMKRLGKKLEEELRPGSVVVSNVFEIPGWKVSTKSDGTKRVSGSGKGVYLYQVPECFGRKETG